jgi:hypothetical protein
MVDAHYFYCLILDPVNNDVGKAGENQFAGAGYPPLATQIWKPSQVPAAIVKGFGYIRSRLRVVLLNVTYDIVEIVCGGSSPTHAH